MTVLVRQLQPHSPPDAGRVPRRVPVAAGLRSPARVGATIVEDGYEAMPSESVDHGVQGRSWGERRQRRFPQYALGFDRTRASQHHLDREGDTHDVAAKISERDRDLGDSATVEPSRN